MPNNRKITKKTIKGKEGLHPGSRKAAQLTRVQLRVEKLKGNNKARKDHVAARGTSPDGELDTFTVLIDLLLCNPLFIPSTFPPLAEYTCAFPLWLAFFAWLLPSLFNPSPSHSPTPPLLHPLPLLPQPTHAFFPQSTHHRSVPQATRSPH